jgi:hypothetical protein
MGVDGVATWWKGRAWWKTRLFVIPMGARLGRDLARSGPRCEDLARQGRGQGGRLGWAEEEKTGEQR